MDGVPALGYTRRRGMLVILVFVAVYCVFVVVCPPSPQLMRVPLP